LRPVMSDATLPRDDINPLYTFRIGDGNYRGGRGGGLRFRSRKAAGSPT
jgi:hypothetical protein